MAEVGELDQLAAHAPSGYRLLASLRRGREYEVFDAWSELRASRCVIKTLRAEQIKQGSARQRLLREGELLCQLTHPHLLRGYEVIAGDNAFVVTETLGGATLAHLVEQGNRLDALSVAHLAQQAGSALAYLHRQGWLHRDVKPSNIVIDESRVRLIDLSLAGKPGPVPRGLGTARYLAPEQAWGQECTSATDVWGLGITLFEAATGSHPFSQNDDASSCSSCGEREEYPQASSRVPRLTPDDELPQELAQLINACVEPNPADRASLEDVMACAARVAGTAYHRAGQPGEPGASCGD